MAGPGVARSNQNLPTHPTFSYMSQGPQILVLAGTSQCQPGTRGQVASLLRAFVVPCKPDGVGLRRRSGLPRCVLCSQG